MFGESSQTPLIAKKSPNTISMLLQTIFLSPASSHKLRAILPRIEKHV